MRKPPRSLEKAKEKQMGRPIKKKSIGTTSATGNQIQATAIIPGNAQVFTDAYVVSQKGTGKYVMASPSTSASDLVSLVNGPLTAAGQANVVVTPWGAHGSGATVTANLGINSFSYTVIGAGAIGNNYKIGESLALVGGTGTAGSITVDSLQIGNVTIGNSAGTGGFTNTSYLIFNNENWSSPANVHVTTVSNGNITGLAIVDAGVYVNPTLPGIGGLGTNIQPDVILGGGSYATVNLQLSPRDVQVGAVGDYSTIPANPVSLAMSAFGGTGAKVNVTWKVSSLDITAAGTGYDAVNLVFGSGAAAATATLTGGGLTATTVTSGGSYAAKPTVTVQPITSPVYAAVIYDNTVKDFNGNEYSYRLDQTTLTGPGQATIQSA